MFKDKKFYDTLASIGENPQIFINALVLKPEAIHIGDNVRIDDFSRIEGGSGLWIGNYVHIASFASILAGGEAIIEDFCGLAQGAKLITGFGHPFEDAIGNLPNGDPFKRKADKIVLGKYSFVAANAVVLPGVSLGEGAVLAACSVATKDIPPWKVAAGVPARIIKSRNQISPL